MNIAFTCCSSFVNSLAVLDGMRILLQFCNQIMSIILTKRIEKTYLDLLRIYSLFIKPESMTFYSG